MTTMNTVWMHGPPQLVGVGVTVGVAVGVGVMLGVGTAHPVAVHASQQLVRKLTHAVPPRRALQCAASGRILHRVVPAALVMQHDTAFGRPQVDRRAQRCTCVRQRAGNCKF
jgi:hypothetical protein